MRLNAQRYESPAQLRILANETLRQRRKRNFQRIQWGLIPRKDSQRVIKQAICKIEFGVSW
jgi:hypothetical protein